jgi:hypothetical protein
MNWGKKVAAAAACAGLVGLAVWLFPLDVVVTVLIGVGIFLPGFLFLVLYVGLVRIRSWAGWNAVILMTSLVSLTALSFASRLLGYQPLNDRHRGIFILVICVLISFAFWQRLYHLLRGPTFNWAALRTKRRRRAGK